MISKGSVGGLPLGNGIPWESSPLLAASAALPEMPWRAAGGEAHPMATGQGWKPAQALDSPLIFEQLVRETADGDAPSRPRPADAEQDWTQAPTQELPGLVVQARPRCVPAQPASAAGSPESLARVGSAGGR